MQKNKKQIVKSIILSFVTHMDAKRLQGLPLTPNERFWISQKKGLEDYIYQQKECLILQSESNASRKKLDALDENALEISPATIYKAITEMEQDGIIENVDGYFRPKRNDGEPYNSHPILKIASDLPITHLPIDDFAVFHVPERYANQLQEGSNLTFTLEGDLKEHKAKVYALDSRVDDETRTFKVRAHYDNSYGKVVPGRYVNITLTTQQYTQTIAVPSEAILSEMGIDKVFLYKNGVAEPNVIKKGIRTADKVQVISGLNIGDTVIVSGTMQIRTGQKVTLDEVK